MNKECAQRITALLEGRHNGDGTDELDNGAMLVIAEHDGTEIIRAPLARHHRIEPEDPHVLWIRPVLGGYPSAAPGGEYVFNLSISRRRAITWTDAAVEENGDVILTLEGGQTATIQPAAGAELEELRRWDDFTLNILTTEEERDLDLLQADSWHGRFS